MISVALLTRNGGPDLISLLEMLERQAPGRPDEIVAVDSGSTDGSLEQMQARGVLVHAIAPADFQFGRTRDLAFSLTRGETIVTLSQDAVPMTPDWLAKLVAPLADARVDAVCGKTQPWSEPRRVFFWERHGGYDFTRSYERWRTRYDGVGFTNICAAFRRAAWERVRFGSVSMSEDKVFQKRLTESGGCAVYEGQAVVYHGHDYTMGELRKRIMNEGLGWRLAGERYTLRDALYDAGEVFRVASLVHRTFVWGRRTRVLRTRAEVAFPIVRPWFEWAGFHLARGYQS